MRQFFILLLLILSPFLHATEIKKERILYLDTVKYIANEVPPKSEGEPRLHVAKYWYNDKFYERHLYDFKCSSNMYREIEIDSKDKPIYGEWAKVLEKSIIPIYMSRACEKQNSFGKEYPNLNQCIEGQMAKFGQCGSDRDCMTTVSACQRFIPKNCYFSTYGIRCTELPADCTESDIGTVECKLFGK